MSILPPSLMRDRSARSNRFDHRSHGTRNILFQRYGPSSLARGTKILATPASLRYPRYSCLIRTLSHFVQALEIGHLGRVAGFHQGLEATLDQLDQAAAEHHLLARVAPKAALFSCVPSMNDSLEVEVLYPA